MATLISFIHWRDAAFGPGDYEERANIGLVDLREVGLILKEDAESVTLTMETDGKDERSRIRLSIPNSCIQERIDVPIDAFLKWARRRKKAGE